VRHVPRVIITDKLRSYGPAKAETLSGVEHIQQKDQNNRAENSHQPTGLRERVMRARHHYKTRDYREVMKSRFAVWQEVVCLEGNHPLTK